ncbi:MAG: PDZ domain-containing protein [Acidobacteriota bacterium]|nr:PDZ domain-containing protein [Acidobacteriota bacterium]
MCSQPGARCIPKAIALLLALIAAVALFPSLGNAQRAAKKLSKQDVIDLLTGDVPSDQVAQEARKSGISFQVTASVAKEIHDAGGSDDLIRTLRTLAASAPAAPQTNLPAVHSSSPPVLVIESKPGRSQVYVDDEPVGSTSQQGRLKLTQLPPGDHRVRISLSGYEDREENVTLIAGQTATVDAPLSRVAAQEVTPPAPSPQPEEPSTPSTGQPGFLGVMAMQPQPSGARGVVISGASPGSPAEQAGLKAYDTILAINGRRVTTLQNIHDALLGHQVGESVQVTWYNGSRNITQPVQLVVAPQQSEITPQPPPSPSPSPGNFPHTGVVTFMVGHDHQQNAQNYCIGIMTIGNGMIYYKGVRGNGPVHNYEIPLDTIKEARRNTLYLVAIGGFHIKLKKGSNYNFVVLNQQNQYQPPDAILAAIDNAMGR